ncbi:Lrp/AsnC family transcriptional regulator [Candidatus Nanohalovita haloferacivicina]|uniref:Lrp/AsnC family transcriptional regulator n=1 Tax=Candidatus Nanohalovita haloferacivicina TaxID=2978046 RepID=UPI00325FB4D3|nr:DNA-binding transcriptional regulator, Lrp family [Candidatus Nanohalobia archaeon BNXNv]
MKESSVDDKDFRIIEQLLSDGRASLRKIAEKVDVSPSTASNRFKKLLDNGVIKGFVPVLDYEKMGYTFSTITHIKSEPGEVTPIAEKLKDEAFIEQCYSITGDADIIVLAHFKDRESMNSSLQKIQSMEGIEETKTNVILESYRQEMDL